MWRSFFLAIGVSLCILGAECMVVEKAVFALPAGETEPASIYGPGQPGTVKHEVEPPEWAPWSLISAGVVISLYSVTLARE